jgi:hypothetical protein
MGGQLNRPGMEHIAELSRVGRRPRDRLRLAHQALALAGADAEIATFHDRLAREAAALGFG